MRSVLNSVEVLQVTVESGSACAGHVMSEIAWPQDSLIATLAAWPGIDHPPRGNDAGARRCADFCG